jgi:hypothetical protein
LEAVLILGIWSIALVGEQPFYRFLEHMYLGITLGYFILTIIKTIISTAVTPLGEGNFLAIIPLVLGLALYLRFTQSFRWISRWGVAVVIAVGMAVGLRGMLFTYIIQQVKSAATTNFVTGSPLTNFNSVLMTVITIIIMMFFLFTYLRGEKQGSAIFQIRKIARVAIMVLLGAYFANVTMARFTLIAGSMARILAGFGIT